MTFCLCKITTANGIQKLALSGPALSIIQYVGNYVPIDTVSKQKILDGTKHVSSKSIESHWYACAVERYEQTSPVKIL